MLIYRLVYNATKNIASETVYFSSKAERDQLAKYIEGRHGTVHQSDDIDISLVSKEGSEIGNIIKLLNNLESTKRHIGVN